MNEAKTVTCRWCKAEMPDDPGAYYHRRDCERRAVQDRLEHAQAMGATDEQIAELEAELLAAGNTGD